MSGVEGIVALLFEDGNGWVEFAGGDLCGGGVDVAELAGSEIVFRGAHRRTEGAADDGPGFVEIAGAVRGIQDWAGFCVAEAFSGFGQDFVGEEWGGFVVFVEDAGDGVAGVVWGQAVARGGGSLFDSLGAGGVGLAENVEGMAEAPGVLL